MLFSRIRQRSKSKNEPAPLPNHQVAVPVEISTRQGINSIAFLADGQHVVSGGEEGKLRQWRVEDGKQVGMPMDAGSAVVDIAVSRDGRWVASGAKTGQVMLWNPSSQVKLNEIKAHKECVYALDISPDGTRIATGSADKTVRVWSTSSAERLFRPLKHDSWVIAVKFSPDGQLIATATADRGSIRIYDAASARRVGEFRIQVGLAHNKSLAWASDSKRLFAVSDDRSIHCLDVSTSEVLSSWPIHSDGDPPLCIALTSDDAFVVVTSNSSVSFWDATTRQLIGSVVRNSSPIWSMAVSPNYDFVTAGNHRIIIRNLRDTLPVPYRDEVSVPRRDVRFMQLKQRQREREPRPSRVERTSLGNTIRPMPTREPNADMEDLERTIQDLRDQLLESRRENGTLKETVQFLLVQQESSNRNLVDLDGTIHELRNQLSMSKHMASEKEDQLNRMIKSLRSDLRTRGNT